MFKKTKEELNKRINDLQTRLFALEQKNAYYIWNPHKTIYPERIEIPIKDLIELLFNHLNVKICWDSGIPAHAKLEDKNKKEE